MTTLRRQLNEFQGQEQPRVTQLRSQLTARKKDTRLMREQLNDLGGRKN